jgi:Tfp pilus assembly protein PilF
MSKWLWLGTAGVMLLCGCVAPRAATEADALSDKACKAIQSQDYEKAEVLLKEALELEPKNAFAWLNLGVVYQKSEKYEEAKECYLKVVEHAWDEKGANKEADGRSLVRIARDNLEKIPAH